MERYKVVGNSDTLTKEEWLALRGIGGSTVGIILGLNDYQSPYELWWNMTNHIEPDIDNEATRWGKLMEPMLRAWFKGEMERLYPESIVQANPDVMQSVEYPFLTANIDGEIFLEPDGWGVVEIKTTSAYSKNFEDDTIPDSYYAQIQYYMWMTGRSYGYMVWLKNKTPSFQRVERNEEFIEVMIAKAVEFWRVNVCLGIPPEMVGLKSEEELILQRYGLSDPEKLIEAPEMEPTVLELKLLKEQIKGMEKEGTKLENELKFVMGDAEVLLAGEHRVTWKTSSNGRRVFKVW